MGLPTIDWALLRQTPTKKMFYRLDLIEAFSQLGPGSWGIVTDLTMCFGEDCGRRIGKLAWKGHWVFKPW